MTDRFQADVMEDMLSEATEGPAQAGFDEGDEGDESWDAGESEADEYNTGAPGGRAGGAAQGADELEEDEYDGFEEFEAGAEEGDYASLEDAVADALEEDDGEAFLRRLRRIARTAATVGRGIGRVARVAAPILTRIPIPQVQAVGRLAQVAGRLLADGADEFEAIDELVDSYDDEEIDAAAPLIAGMALRRVMPQVRRMPLPARRQLVRGVSQAVHTLVRRQGAPAARAAARLVQTAQRAVRQRQMPARAVPAAVRRAAQRVAQTPRAVQRLARPLAPGAATGAARGAVARPVGRGYVGGAYGGGGVFPLTRTRRFVLTGPATITIAVARR